MHHAVGYDVRGDSATATASKYSSKSIFPLLRTTSVAFCRSGSLQGKGAWSLMKDFAGKIAVITGGGTGMGRELARQLVAEGCNVAMCDVSADAMAETKRLCEVEQLPQGLRVTTHIADVSIEDQLKRFRDEIAEQQDTDKIHLLFNNAGIGGGGSLFTNTASSGSGPSTSAGAASITASAPSCRC